MHPALAKLGVVIPVGPGDALVPALRAQLGALPRESELRVVYSNADDAARLAVGASDDTGPGAPPGPDTRSLFAPRGRASQQNAGARDTSRDWLWFLHADSVLAQDTLPALAAFLQRDDHGTLGYFDLRFLDDGPIWMRLTAAGTWVRSRLLGLPFGDQGLVLPRAVFERLGGFDPVLACGEDHDLVWRARRAGLRLHPLRAPLYTSARKYAEHGWCATTCRHLGETWRQARAFSRAGTL